jgi:hypothetical protein
MQRNSSYKANISSASQEIRRILQDTKFITVFTSARQLP